MIGKILKGIFGFIMICGVLYYMGVLGKVVRYADKTCDKHNIPYKPSSIFGEKTNLDRFEENQKRDAFFGLISRDGYFYTPIVLVVAAIFTRSAMYYITHFWFKFLVASGLGNYILFKNAHRNNNQAVIN